jgi:hypothetical protein
MTRDVGTREAPRAGSLVGDAFDDPLQAVAVFYEEAASGLAGTTRAQGAAAFFRSMLRLLETADWTEWHPDRAHYRKFSRAAAELAAAAVAFGVHTGAFDDGAATVERLRSEEQRLDDGWQKELRPRREWTQLVRAEAVAVADALAGSADPDPGPELGEMLERIVLLCLDMMVWLESRGANPRRGGAEARPST